MRSFSTMPPTLTSRQALLAVLVAGTLALSVGACGRRGRPEPPPDPNAPAKTQQQSKAADAKAARSQPTFQTRPGAVAQNDDDDDTDDDDAAVLASPQPTPSGRKKSQPYVVPKEPFILDPLL